MEKPQDTTNHDRAMMVEAERLTAEGKKRDLHLRLLGAMAFQAHCPRHSFLTAKLGRALSDIDFAAYTKEVGKIGKMMKELGYVDNPVITALFGHKRMIWDNESNGQHVDIFFDKLQMNHDIPFDHRLELEELTIPLADMLLEKMQIVNINEKDVIDIIMLLREHAIGHAAPETIDTGYVTAFLSNDWGFYYTVTENLKKIQNRLPYFGELTEEDRADISRKIQTLLKIIEDEPKTLGWKMRAKVGTKKKWYREVEELNR
jgi:hypothetical protein